MLLREGLDDWLGGLMGVGGVEFGLVVDVVVIGFKNARSSFSSP